MRDNTYLGLSVKSLTHKTLAGILTIFHNPLALFPQSDITAKKENGSGGHEIDRDADNVPTSKRLWVDKIRDLPGRRLKCSSLI